MKNWLNKDPENIYYLISFYCIIGIAMFLFNGAVGFFN